MKQWNKIITNALENVWIASPFEDWDDTHSSIAEYQRKQKANELEMVVLLFINGIFSIGLLTPVWILQYNVNLRHEFLEKTIGAYPEEVYAHWLVNFLGTYMSVLYMG